LKQKVFSSQTQRSRSHKASAQDPAFSLAPPDGEAEVSGLAGKARRWRERRFSRRDALCASALRGRAYAEA